MATEEPTKTYRGNCHCGAFVYEAELPEIKGGTTCSCSICFKKGTRILYTPTKNVRVVKGDESGLTKYQFNSKTITHMFCANCGSPVLAKGGEGENELYGLNANCIQGLDLSALEDKFIDGASIGENRVPPPYSGPEPTAEIEGAKIYHGSCTCGAVGIAVKNKDLHSSPDAAGPRGLIRCDCSICARNGNVWIYPLKEQVALQGRESLSHYSFNNKLISKAFCKICGVNLTAEWIDVSQEHLDTLPELTRQFREMSLGLLPVNLRVLDDFSLKGLDIEYTPGDHGTPYVNP